MTDERKSVRFEDEDEAYSAEEYRAITSQSNSVSEWELNNRHQAAQESDDDWWEQQNTKKTVRDIGKGVRADLQKTITRKGGDNNAQAAATNAIYEEMGGSPEPKGNRNRWKGRDLQRTAVNELMAKQEIDQRLPNRDRYDQRSGADQRLLNDQIKNAARDGARKGETLQNDPETGVGTGGWFGFFFGTHHEKEPEREPEAVQQELPLDEKPDPNREWTMGDIARAFFLGGRDEKLF